MTPKQEAALRLAREALKLNCSSQTESPATKAITAIDEALAEPKEKYRYGTPLLDAMTGKTEQPAQPCGYPYCGCNSKAWCKVEHQSGIKQVIELYDSPEQPAQQEPVAWTPIKQPYPQGSELDILMGDGSILCAVLPQADGDLWWRGAGTGEKFIDPKYASVTHWRIHAAHGIKGDA